MKRLPLVIIFFLLLGACLLRCGDATGRSTRLKGLFNTYHQNRRFSGVVLVALGEDVLFHQAYGLADRRWGIANSRQTRMYIASLAKNYTAALVLRQAEQGRLNVTDQTGKYLPRYPRWHHVRVHHLLTHTSGIRDVFNTWSANDLRHTWTAPDFLKRMARFRLLFTPGQKHAYSNTGYTALAEIVERCEGKSFSEALKKNITTPLGLKDTGVFVNADIVPNLARSYIVEGDGRVMESPYVDLSMLRGAGHMYATAGDVYRWILALADGHFLTPKYKKLMFHPHVRAYFPGIRDLHYGYGWRVKNRTGPGNVSHPVFFHTGLMGGFQSLVCYAEKKRAIIVILANLVDRGDKPFVLLDYQNAILDILYGMPEATITP